MAVQIPTDSLRELFQAAQFSPDSDSAGPSCEPACPPGDSDAAPPPLPASPTSVSSPSTVAPLWRNNTGQASGLWGQQVPHMCQAQLSAAKTKATLPGPTLSLLPTTSSHLCLTSQALVEGQVSWVGIGTNSSWASWVITKSEIRSDIQARSSQVIIIDRSRGRS